MREADAPIELVRVNLRTDFPAEDGNVVLGLPKEGAVPFADVIERARESLQTVRVFSEPIERDGLTVITAATVSGGGGGGEGQDESGQNGVGGGFGVHARPAGAYVITDGGVTWRPAINLNVVVGAAAAVVVAYLWMRARTNVARARHGA